MSLTPGSWLAACELPDAWRAQAAWRVLETCFGHAERFLTCWQAWQADPNRPRMLHYVALSPVSLTADALLADGPLGPGLNSLARVLAQQCYGLLPGFHRLSFDEGRVLLTLCIGDRTPLLRELQFVADSLLLDATDPCGPPWDSWTAKALARHARRGTRVALVSARADLAASLASCGFVWSESSHDGLALRGGEFNPHWQQKTTRARWREDAAAVADCTVIGAGLAGASVAASLARRGWRVQVFDQAMTPAAGASDLPVGLLSPHVSSDDCVLSRLSRSGIRQTTQQARSLLRHGHDWAATGVLEHRIDGSTGPGVPWPQAGSHWSCEAPPALAASAWQAGVDQRASLLWHPCAAWIKPAELVKAWLAQPGVHFQGGARVHAICRNATGWTLLGEAGQAIGSSARVVLANANGALPLLRQAMAYEPGLAIAAGSLPTTYGVRGQVSWARHSQQDPPLFPATPINGSGSLIPHVPWLNGAAWFLGASYQPDTMAEWPVEKNHLANLGRLGKLLPELGQALATRFESGQLEAWRGTRCVTADRLPMVGPLYDDPNASLWICAGMGSRGLSYSMLCAELLAARWSAEPLPLEASLAGALDARRRPLIAEAGSAAIS
ncbi:FAD-dependent 5-carboxymethylaminomethyl-2-thiouridine(34) oxidoreductase MnmC [Rhodoferax sp.]|uniref:FAD-dependent 5-carboxymethylaminomethyl-2-thiouridine(34) oxidoreductase MnmC n=1 Tax=Rhodoferax sp. TaxID=50421 RepID=UPI00276409F2|nr:FAD-dependent 5-carboxymethylaminomethyl-2-thiouridine(34) oxidoreductase MnmC [Rhodoferax sp.]